MHLAKPPLETFLAQPWWAGVQGILAILGVLAITVAVIDFIIRQSEAAPRAMAFKTNRSGVVENGHIDITITARPMGPHVLYEPEVRVWGYTERGLNDLNDDLPAVLTASDDPIIINLRVPHEKLSDAWVGVCWVVPKRWVPHAAGSRIQLNLRSDYQRWELYRWYRWPRRISGRWVANREGRAGGPMHIP